MADITVVSPDELPAPEGSDHVSRQLVFETEDTIVSRSRVAGGVTTDWHHNGDRTVYGYVTEGRARLEFGPDGRDAVELTGGDFVYVPPQTVRRVVNVSDEDWEIVISFVGAGPPATTVAGPDDGS